MDNKVTNKVFVSMFVVLVICVQQAHCYAGLDAEFVWKTGEEIITTTATTKTTTKTTTTAKLKTTTLTVQ